MTVELQKKTNKKMSPIKLPAAEIISLTDSELLSILPFRESSLIRPAMDGDIDQLSRRLQASLHKPFKEFERLLKKYPTANPFAPQKKKQLPAIAAALANTVTESIQNGHIEIAMQESAKLLDLLAIAGPKLSREQFWQLWRLALVALSSDLLQASSTKERDQLSWHAELNLKAGLFFACLKGTSRVAKTGVRLIREHLLEATDTDGTPHAETIEQLPLWIPMLGRCLYWAQIYDTELWTDQAEDRFQELLRIIGPLCIRNGEFITNHSESATVTPLLVLLTEWAGWSRKSPLAKLLNASLARQSSNDKLLKKTSNKTKALPGTQSDWAHVAVLRNGWLPEDDTLLVTHHNVLPQLYLAAKGNRIIAGTWDLQLMIDEKPVMLDDEGWSCVAWHSDQDADYLELQMSLENDIRLERQLLLPRGEHTLLLADTVSGPENSRIVYSSSLPLSESVIALPDQYTREVLLKRKSQTIRACPLTLEQDRINSTPGELLYENQRLCFRQQGETALYASLVLDWEPKRKTKQADWRKLTISEQQQMLPLHVAVAQRLRVGKSQLFNYRSLAKSSHARCALGHHTFHETVIGRFNTDGEVEPYVLVD